MGSPNYDNARPVDRRRKPPYFFFGVIALIGCILISKAILAVNDSINNRVSTYISRSDLDSIREEIKLLKEYNKVIVGTISVYNKNEKAFSYNTESAICAKCHLQTNMYLLRSSLSFTDFKDYVRNTKRHIVNTEMPAFSEKDISEKTLESIYLILKQ